MPMVIDVQWNRMRVLRQEPHVPASYILDGVRCGGRDGRAIVQCIVLFMLL